MSAGTLARRYAKALIELAGAAGEADLVAKQLADLAASWETSSELRDVFENPAIPSELRKKLLASFVQRSGATKLVTNTLGLLEERQRLRLLPHLSEAYNRLAEAQSGRVRAEVTTATEMPADYYQSLTSTLETVTGKKVVLEKKQDESLIAGLVTRVGDTVFDGSLKNRLREMKEELLAR